MQPTTPQQPTPKLQQVTSPARLRATQQCPASHVFQGPSVTLRGGWAATLLWIGRASAGAAVHALSLRGSAAAKRHTLLVVWGPSCKQPSTCQVQVAILQSTPPDPNPGDDDDDDQPPSSTPATRKYLGNGRSPPPPDPNPDDDDDDDQPPLIDSSDEEVPGEWEESTAA